LTLWSVNSARLVGTGLYHTPYAGLVSKEEERSTVYFSPASPPSHPDAVWAAATVFADLVPKSLTIQYACSSKNVPPWSSMVGDLLPLFRIGVQGLFKAISRKLALRLAYETESRTCTDISIPALNRRGGPSKMCMVASWTAANARRGPR